MTDQIINELRAAKNIAEIFDILKKHFELEYTELTILNKNILINNLSYFIEILKIKERK